MSEEHIESAAGELHDSHEELKAAEEQLDDIFEGDKLPEDKEIDKAFEEHSEASTGVREADANLQIAQAETLKSIAEKLDLLLTKITPAEAAAPATEPAADAIREIEPEGETKTDPAPAPAAAPEEKPATKKRGFHLGGH